MKHLTANPELQIKAYSMKEVLFEGKAFSLSAANNIGPLDVLPGHANMLAILTDCTVAIETEQGAKTFAIDNGILKVSSNQISLFINV
jgi:F-type H+-transporting ATPase subunit epsilon